MPSTFREPYAGYKTNPLLRMGVQRSYLRARFTTGQLPTVDISCCSGSSARSGLPRGVVMSELTPVDLIRNGTMNADTWAPRASMAAEQLLVRGGRRAAVRREEHGHRRHAALACRRTCQ